MCSTRLKGRYESEAIQPYNLTFFWEGGGYIFSFFLTFDGGINTTFTPMSMSTSELVFGFGRRRCHYFRIIMGYSWHWHRKPSNTRCTNNCNNQFGFLINSNTLSKNDAWMPYTSKKMYLPI